MRRTLSARGLTCAFGWRVRERPGRRATSRGRWCLHSRSQGAPSSLQAHWWLRQARSCCLPLGLDPGSRRSHQDLRSLTLILNQRPRSDSRCPLSLREANPLLRPGLQAPHTDCRPHRSPRVGRPLRWGRCWARTRYRAAGKNHSGRTETGIERPGRMRRPWASCLSADKSPQRRCS